jgi:acetyl esterase/lipase
MASSTSSESQPQAGAQQIPSDWPGRRQLMQQIELAGTAALGPIPESVEEFWTTITLSDGWQSKAKVTRPKQMTPSGKHPLIVLFHGGAFVVGTPDQVNRPARDFAEKFGAVVVSPSYKLAPEDPWPAPMRSAWEVLGYLAKNAESEFGANLDAPDGGFVIGGFSAGANVTAVLAGICASGDGVDTPLAKPLTGVFTSLPGTLVEETVPDEYRSLWTSRVDNANAEGFNTAKIKVTLDAMNCTNYASPWYSPIGLLVAGNGHDIASRHAATYIQVGEYDPLRDDGVVYEKVLANNGVPTKIDLWKGQGHTGWTAQPGPSEDALRIMGQATMSGMEWLLAGAPKKF